MHLAAEHVDNPFAGIEPHRVIAAHVLLLALRDASSPGPTKASGRRAARKFLRGPMLTTWAELAGLDPAHVRRLVGAR